MHGGGYPNQKEHEALDRAMSDLVEARVKHELEYNLSTYGSKIKKEMDQLIDIIKRKNQVIKQLREELLNRKG